jgi:dihydroorotase
MAAKMNLILLKNGEACIDKNLVKKDIIISNGKIKEISDKIEKIPVEKKNILIIDCEGKIILPGFIDGHVHFRDPGRTEKEDFFTGSCAAVAGGITTIIDMPNTKPPTLTINDLEEKRKIAASKCLVNFGFHFGSSVNNLEEIKKSVKISCVASTKVFMNWSTGDMKIDDEKTLEQIFRNSKIVAAHAEEEKMKQAVELAKNTGTKLYICHLSCASEIEYLRKEKAENIFCEVTPNHLFLTEDSSNPFLAVKPELKSEKDRKALWEALNEGLIDTIATDHAPHLISEKESENPPSGIPGEETMLPLMLDAVNNKKISLQKVVECCCENPARIFEIEKKGFIKEGFDADLAIVDMNLKKKVENEKLFTKCRWSPFNGKTLKGWPVVTIVNGNIVYNDGKIDDKVKGKEVKFR